MRELIEQIRERLHRRAYVNEAAISHGIIMPIIKALGWDTADPQQVVPEYSVSGRRVDFALFGLGHKPAVFLEVKQPKTGTTNGSAVNGDRQLFEYCFHQGVPLCVLTDGREWSFYLPSGTGSYEDRRVYRLQIDDREPSLCEEMLVRYLSRDRIRDRSAIEAALRDHRDAERRREAIGILPRAWRDLIAEANQELIDALTDKAEALCGYTPGPEEVIAFLEGLSLARPIAPASRPTVSSSSVSKFASAAIIDAAPPMAEPVGPPAPDYSSPDKSVTYALAGERRTTPNASIALVEILRAIVSRDPSRIPDLAKAVSGTKINHIAGSAEEINPAKPELARPAEIAPGWMVGLTISNRTKMGIIRAACEVYGLKMPQDLEIVLPNA